MKTMKEQMKELKADVERVYEAIQHLQIQPTKNNVAIILDSIQVLEAVHKVFQDSIEHAEEDQK